MFRFEPLRNRLSQAAHQLADQPPALKTGGRVVRVVGLVLACEGFRAPVGQRCRVGTQMEAEVVGFQGEQLLLMALGDLAGITPGAPVEPLRHSGEASVGPALLGRVLDGAGRPLDGKGPLRLNTHVPLKGKSINPLTRKPICQALDVGVRAINALLTIGQGQRMGLFAGSGVGKSVLLGMMARYTNADVIVVGLIGERGREVQEFIEQILGEQGIARSVVVAAPADAPALLRLRGADLATAIAEYYRAQGLQVLLLMDSLTRYAQALREIALAVGEPPATKGYPPSVFARLPALVERTGNADGGSITAFYTVLSEGDDLQDPIADSARAILDGHIVLSRSLAEQGHYPAIDIEASVSRLLPELVDPAALNRVLRFKQVYSRYRQSQDLVQVGAYQAGSDPLLEQALPLVPRWEAFLRQAPHESTDLLSAQRQLADLVPG